MCDQDLEFLLLPSPAAKGGTDFIHLQRPFGILYIVVVGVGAADRYTVKREGRLVAASDPIVEDV